MDHLDAEQDLLQRIGDRLALLAREQVGYVGRTLADQIRSAMKDARALIRMDAPPRDERARCRVDGTIDVDAGRNRTGTDRCPGRRVRDGKSSAFERIDPGTIDEELAIHHDQRAFSRFQSCS